MDYFSVTRSRSYLILTQTTTSTREDVSIQSPASIGIFKQTAPTQLRTHLLTPVRKYVEFALFMTNIVPQDPTNDTSTHSRTLADPAFTNHRPLSCSHGYLLQPGICFRRRRPQLQEPEQRRLLRSRNSPMAKLP